MTDKELKAHALQTLELDELPRERLPIFNREYLSIREVARGHCQLNSNGKTNSYADTMSSHL